MRTTIYCFACLLFLSNRAIAAPSAPSAQERAMAEALFQQAKKLGAAGDLEKACKKFEESFEHDPTLGTKLHSAACYEELGRTASAWAAFSEAAAMALTAGDSERETLAKERVAKLEKQLPRLILEVPDSVEGMQVEVDGQNLSSFGTALPIDPGSHRIKVFAPGYESWETTITVAKGAGTDTLSVPALVSTKDSGGARDGASKGASADGSVEFGGSSTQRTVGFVVGGVGLVALAAGGYFGLQAQSKTEDADAHCSGKFCTPRGLEGHDDAQQAALFSTIGFGVGIAGIATGTLLILTAKSTPERASWVAPYASAAGGGVAAGGRF
jgi:hypothetical protein